MMFAHAYFNLALYSII